MPFASIRLLFVLGLEQLGGPVYEQMARHLSDPKKMAHINEGNREANLSRLAGGFIALVR